MIHLRDVSPSTPPALIVASALLLTTGAAAQQAPERAAPRDGAPSPPPLVVDDPLLAPVAPPPRRVASLRDALALISRRSVDLARQRQEIERAEGLARQALAAALPAINGTGSVTHHILRLTPIEGAPAPNGFIASNPALLASLTASMPVLAPRAWYAIRSAELAVKSAQLATDDRRRAVLAAVASSIVAVFTAERVAEVSRVGLQSSLERLELTKRQLRLGVGTRLDVLRAEQDADAARATLITADESLRKSREALGFALGSDGAYGVLQALSVDEIEQTLRSTCVPGTVDQRPDVLAAKNDVEVARRGLTDVRLGFLPTATLSSTASVGNYTLPSNRDYAWQIQGILTIPIWDGGARYGALRAARAQEEQAKVQLDSVTRGATIENTQATRAVAVAAQARQVSAANRDHAREAAQLARRAYEGGSGTSFDLVDTSQRQRAAELDLAVKEFDLVRARIAAVLSTASCNY